jgi:ERF superfamily
MVKKPQTTDDPETVTKLVDQLPPPHSKTRTLLQRLNAVQGEVDYVQKEKKAGMKYSIVSHDAVTAKVRPLMVKHGVLYYPVQLDLQQVGNRTQGQMHVRFVNVDDARDYIEVATAGYGIDEQDKGPGKAISYAVKYALLKCLGLESGDDPDEDQETKHSDPGNEHNLAMVAFEADIDQATEIEHLEKAAAKHKVAVEKAMAVYPARVMQARAAYAKRLRFLKGG